MTSTLKEKADWASSAGHWYDQDGNPRYTYTNAKGGESATTLREARKFGLVPSVTTVMKLMDKPGLNNWLMDQAILAALTLPRLPDEPDAAYLVRVKHDAKEEGRKAAERGTSIHGSLEAYYSDRSYPAEHREHVKAVADLIRENCEPKFVELGPREWLSEKSAYSPLGYGCKTDLICDDWTIDFKTKEFDADTPLSTYDEHAMQLAANQVAHGYPGNQAAIVYVSVSNPGIVRFCEVGREELNRGWKMFLALLDLWRAKFKYDPRAT